MFIERFSKVGKPFYDVLEIIITEPEVFESLLKKEEILTKFIHKGETNALYSIAARYPQSGLLLAKALQNEPQALNNFLTITITETDNLGLATQLIDSFGADPNFAFRHYITYYTHNEHGIRYNTLKFLLEKGADVNQPVLQAKLREEDGTFLDFEYWYDENAPQRIPANTRAVHQLIRYGYSKEKLQLLKEYGADLNARDAEDNTPLHVAAQWGALAQTEGLRELGADPTITNHQGLTPVQVARRAKYHLNPFLTFNREKRKEYSKVIDALR